MHPLLCPTTSHPALRALCTPLDLAGLCAAPPPARSRNVPCLPGTAPSPAGSAARRGLGRGCLPLAHPLTPRMAFPSQCQRGALLPGTVCCSKLGPVRLRRGWAGTTVAAACAQPCICLVISFMHCPWTATCQCICTELYTAEPTNTELSTGGCSGLTLALGCAPLGTLLCPTLCPGQDVCIALWTVKPNNNETQTWHSMLLRCWRGRARIPSPYSAPKGATKLLRAQSWHLLWHQLPREAWAAWASTA